MDTKIVYNCENATELILDDSDKSPSGAWNVPFGYTEIEPPQVEEGYALQFKNGDWTKNQIEIEQVKEDIVEPVTEIHAESIQFDPVEILNIIAMQEERITALEEGR